MYMHILYLQAYYHPYNISHIGDTFTTAYRNRTFCTLIALELILTYKSV